MIEVLFGESEAGAMRMAARKYKKKLGNDVICLAFLLDIGNIQEAVDSTYRKNFIFNFYAQEQWGKDIEMESSLRKAGEAYQEELDRFKQYLQYGIAKILILYVAFISCAICFNPVKTKFLR